jgi:hypothetical protein
MAAISNLIDAAMKKSIIWNYDELIEFIKNTKFIPNPKYFEEKYIIYMLKRK